jgi:hypothetical protein
LSSCDLARLSHDPLHHISEFHLIGVNGDGISRRNEWCDGTGPILGIARNEARQNRLVLCRANRITALRGASYCSFLRCRIKENLALCVWEHHGANVTTGKHRPTTSCDVSLHCTEGISNTRN